MRTNMLHTPTFEATDTEIGDFTPNLDRQFMFGSRVVALVGPPAVGRRRIITTATEMFPDDITALDSLNIADSSSPDTSGDPAILRIGVVAEPQLWFHRMTHRYLPGNPERAVQRQEAIDCLQWLSRYSDDVLILYNFDRRPNVTAGQLHAYLMEGQGNSTEATKLLPNLMLAAETMGI